MRLGALARGVGLDLCLLYLSMALAAAVSVDRAGTIGAALALAELMAVTTAIGAAATLYGLYRAGQQLRRRYREWTGDQLCDSLAWIGFGLATVVAAQALRLLSSTGQIPLP